MPRKEAPCRHMLLLQWSQGQSVAIDFVCTHPARVAHQPLVAENATKHCNRAEAQKVQADGPSYEARDGGSPRLPSAHGAGSGPDPRGNLACPRAPKKDAAKRKDEGDRTSRKNGPAIAPKKVFLAGESGENRPTLSFWILFLPKKIRQEDRWIIRMGVGRGDVA